MELGVIAFAVCFVLTVFGVRNSPEQMGMEPYGAGEKPEAGTQEEEESGFEYAQVWRSPAFYVTLCYGFMVILLTSFAQQIYSYADCYAHRYGECGKGLFHYVGGDAYSESSHWMDV